VWEEFKKFIMRGSVLDMAVGIIIGAAFTSVVQSLVNDVLMPPIGRVLGGVDFAGLFINLGPGTYETLAEAQEAGAPTINYGLFINALLSFLIVALVVFLLVKAFNRMQKEEETPSEPTSKECPECLSEIPIQARRCAFCTTVLEGA
jgi:large conductance mechanosensitive channel